MVIEGRKGNLYGKREVDIAEATTKVRIELAETYGNLFIKTEEEELTVYLDGRPLEELGSGFFERIPVGRHTLELKGKGLYYKDEVEIKADESTRFSISSGSIR